MLLTLLILRVAGIARAREEKLPGSREDGDDGMSSARRQSPVTCFAGKRAFFSMYPLGLQSAASGGG